MPDPEPPKKKGFNWGALVVGVVAAVAVAAAVVTFGVGAVLIGAVIGAAVGIASTAIGDAITGNKSSFGDYVRNAFVGAVSGAIFGPFGAFKSLGGMVAFGGISGMADSLLNQAMTGEFSLGQTLLDGLIGAATAGLLHGMGKVVSKVSPYLKNGISKVLSKASSGAKKILSKVSGKLDDVLGAFSKTSKELFYKVANKADDVLLSIKNSAQDLVDRLAGKFNQITSKIDDKIDDALRSMVGKADDALNSINKWMNKELSLGLVPADGELPPPNDIKPIENLISKMSGFKKASEVGVKGYTGFKNFTEVKYDNVVATGKDAFGKTTKWVIPKGYDSVDDFLRKVSDEDLLKMGYASKDEFRETVANLEKYLNKKPKNTIRNQSLADSKHPVTDTPYDVLGLPTFNEKDIRFKCNLKDANIIDTDTNQFKDCTRQLKEKINKGEISKSLFTQQQLDDIEAEKEIINGLTWNHDKVTGKMQLVDFDSHSKTGHLGGNNIWGEGVRNNKDLQAFNGN